MGMREDAKAEIERHLQRIPASVRYGSYNMAVDYKKAVAAARRVLSARNSTLESLQNAASGLRRFG